jgi:PAS domain-containing protein
MIVERFVRRQNVDHFEKLLAAAVDPTTRRTLEVLLASARRSLALLDSAERGADVSPLEVRRRAAADAPSVREQLRSEFDGAPHPYMLLDPGPGLAIVDVNDAYAAATLIVRSEVVGKSLFEVFPDNPVDPAADGVSNLFASLKAVALTGEPHAMAIQRYDIRTPNGAFVERHWLPINRPIQDSRGRLVFLLHHVEDVTEQIKSTTSVKDA